MVQHGLASDHVQAEVQHLGHRVLRAVQGDLRELLQPLPQAGVQLHQRFVALRQRPAEQRGRLRHADGVGQVFGTGAHPLLLPATQIRRLNVVALAQVQRADALGGVDLVAAHRVAVNVRQPHWHPHPGLHTVHVHGGAVVAGLHPGGQAGHVHGGAGFVVHLHGGHQNGVFIHQLQHPVHIQVAVRLRGHKLHIVALLGQALHGQGHAGVLKAGAYNALAPLAGAGRAQNGQVVPLRAAAGEVHLPRRGPQSAGHIGPGLVQGQLTVGARGVQAGGVGPVLGHRLRDGLDHLRVHHGGGGIVQVMNVRVVQHGCGSSFLLTAARAGPFFARCLRANAQTNTILVYYTRPESTTAKKRRSPAAISRATLVFRRLFAFVSICF